MDLETILQNFGYKKVFRKNGELSVAGAKAYGKLLDILFNLSQIGVMTDEDVDRITDALDEILNQNI